jgi:hypothetical protein
VLHVAGEAVCNGENEPDAEHEGHVRVHEFDEQKLDSREPGGGAKEPQMPPRVRRYVTVRRPMCRLLPYLGLRGRQREARGSLRTYLLIRRLGSTPGGEITKGALDL